MMKDSVKGMLRRVNIVSLSKKYNSSLSRTLKMNREDPDKDIGVSG